MRAAVLLVTILNLRPMRTIKEPDWKILRRLLPLALERFSERLMLDFQQICADSCSAHDKCVRVFDLAREQQRLMSDIFGDLRRSDALMRAAGWRARKLISDAEFAEFSQDLQETVELILSL